MARRLRWAEQLLLIAYEDGRHFERQRYAAAIFTCRCKVHLGGDHWIAYPFKCQRCHERLQLAPHHEALIASYLMGGWQAVRVTAENLFDHTPL